MVFLGNSGALFHPLAHFATGFGLGHGRSGRPSMVENQSRSGKTGPTKEKKPRRARGQHLIQILVCGLVSLRSRFYDFLVSGPISQLDVLFNFSALVTMFVRFIWPISGLAKRILSCPDQVADYIQRFCHISIFLSEERESVKDAKTPGRLRDSG